MNNNELINELKSRLVSGEISLAEVQSLLHQETSSVSDYIPKTLDTEKASNFSIMKIMYTLGAVIIVLGVTIFVGQIWDDINSFFRVLITLGLGFTFALSGSSFLIQKPDNQIGLVFHFIGGLLVPGGLLVLLSELMLIDLWYVAFAFIANTIFYSLLLSVHKKPLLLFFVFANATISIYLTLAAILSDAIYSNDDIYAYVTMMIGIVYLVLGNSLRVGSYKSLTEALYIFGTLGFFGAGFSQLVNYIFFEIFYSVLLAGGVLLAIRLKSRSILILSTLFLIAYVAYITGEYFALSLGWPMALIILGFIFIGLGYASVTINRNYIAR